MTSRFGWVGLGKMISSSCDTCAWLVVRFDSYSIESSALIDYVEQPGKTSKSLLYITNAVGLRRLDCISEDPQKTCGVFHSKNEWNTL